jgi:hypothetical protein
MSEPLIVKIPHKLGKEEALRRIKPALTKASSSFKKLDGLGMVVIASSPKDFAAAIAIDIPRWERLVTSINLKKK